jgi:hypothetical protein
MMTTSLTSSLKYVRLQSSERGGDLRPGNFVAILQEMSHEFHVACTHLHANIAPSYCNIYLCTVVRDLEVRISVRRPTVLSFIVALARKYWTMCNRPRPLSSVSFSIHSSQLSSFPALLSMQSIQRS